MHSTLLYYKISIITLIIPFFLKKKKNHMLFYRKTTTFNNRVCNFIQNLQEDMRRVIVAIPVLMFLSVAVQAQNVSEVESILAFLGVTDEESADEEDMEQMSEMLSRPLPVNLSSQSRLLASGLFTRYQVASLTDYRRHNGDVLSYAELAAVDGFGEEFVRRLSPFITLESYSHPGSPSEKNLRVRNELALRYNVRKTGTEDALPVYGLKYRLSVGERVSASVSLSPSHLTGNVSWDFKRNDGQVVLGKFNARFGQGLALWNGMSVSGLTSPSSFYRRGAGISRSWSFTGTSSFTGLAGSFSSGNMTVSAMTAVSEGAFKNPLQFSLIPALNLSRRGRYVNVSVTNYAELSFSGSDAMRIPDLKSSLDLSLCLRGVDVYGEIASDWVNGSVAFLSGIQFPAGENVRMAFLLRYYPSSYRSSYSAAPRAGTKTSNEVGMASSAEFAAGEYVIVNGAEGFGASVRRHNATLSIDAMYHPVSKSDSLVLTWQLRPVVTWQWMLSPSFRLATRLNLRFRNWEKVRLRSDIRADLNYYSRYVVGCLRLNAVKAAGTGLLAYLEGGFRNGSVSLYLRQGVFRIDDWDDRIYVYERDAPGSFLVPAYYGRGIWTALTGSWRFARWGKIYVRAGYTSYPFMKEEKPGKAELRLQCMLTL